MKNLLVIGSVLGVFLIFGIHYFYVNNYPEKPSLEFIPPPPAAMMVQPSVPSGEVVVVIDNTPEKDVYDNIEKIVYLFMIASLSLIFICISTYLLLSPKSTQAQKNWAAGIIGMILGFWLK